MHDWFCKFGIEISDLIKLPDQFPFSAVAKVVCEHLGTIGVFSKFTFVFQAITNASTKGFSYFDFANHLSVFFISMANLLIDVLMTIRSTIWVGLRSFPWFLCRAS